MSASESRYRSRTIIKLMTIEVYGRPSDKALRQLRQKAQMLGEGENVVVQNPQAGFARFPS
jgi:hypothetical protein